MGKILVFLSSILLFSGCQVSPPVKHIISIDKNGSLTHPETGQLIEKYNDHINNVTLNNINKNKIIIYIHGGLNTPYHSKKRARELLPLMLDDGYYPIFINWRSGVFTTYWEHLVHHRQGQHWKYFGYVTSPFVMIADLARGILRTPIVWWHKTGSYMKANLFGRFPSEINAVKNTEILKISSSFGETPELVDTRSSTKKISDSVLGGVYLVGGLITAPIFDAVGTGAWGVMKRRTEIMFTKSMPFDVDLSLKKDKKDEKDLSLEEYSKLKKGVLTNFFEALHKKQKSNPNLEIILVAHSMGTFVANNILSLSKWPKIKYSRIIYMAAACSIKDFQLAVVPYLKWSKNQFGNKSTKFFNYMLHPIAENLEAHGYGFGGTGTVLNQIDNFYEDPVSENQRVLGKWENVMNGINYFNIKSIKSQIYLRTMPFDNGYPTTHGDFDNITFLCIGKFWKENFGKTNYCGKALLKNTIVK